MNGDQYRESLRDGRVYKILLPVEWATFEASGRFDGSPFDVQSGFVHCSSRTQAGNTALRFFADEPELVVLAIDTEMLGDAVRWESASGGELFPHVYGPLPRAAVVGVHHVVGAAQVGATLAGS
jgi:uncharacterized protein (DUF952 family)